MLVVSKQRFKSCSRCTIHLVTPPRFFSSMGWFSIPSPYQHMLPWLEQPRKKVLKCLQWQLNVSAQRRHTSPASSVQSLSHVQSQLCDPMDCSTPGLPFHHQLPEFTQTHVHWVGDAIQRSHSLLSSSPPAFNLSHHQGLFKWVSSLHQVARVLQFQLQPQSFQWTLRTNLL